jgi:hypothetical protein
VTRAPALLVLALVPASAGAGAAAPPRPLALTAAPARLALIGSGAASVRIRNPGAKRIAVDVSRAGFALDLRGRPRIVGRRSARSAARWLTLRPAHLVLAPQSAAQVHVTARVPRAASPGDHDALVVLSARPLARARVSVRLRLGVVVLVRAPGAVVRRLKLGPLRPTQRGSTRALELVVVNAGNVTERLRRVRSAVYRLPTSRHVETLAAGARELRPRTRGVLDFRLRSRERGLMIARVVIPGEPGRAAIHRTYRIRI